MTSLAFARPDDPQKVKIIAAALREAGADCTVNNLWMLGWIGGYDKLAMSRRILTDRFGVSAENLTEAILYAGDSANDAPMFGFFPHSVGVSTVRRHLAEIATPPRWITSGPGGDGFVEIADAVIVSRQ